MVSTLKKYYQWSAIFTLAALIAGYFIGGIQAVIIVGVLAILETSLSFDNAVVNARILNGWDDKWRHIFLTWGIWIAVFGMRVIFPIAIVAITTGINPYEVTKLALLDPAAYAGHLTAVHHEVAGFGGAFLFMVAFGFFFEEKHVYWLEAIETRLTKLGQIEGISAAFTLIIIALVSGMFTDQKHATEFLISGVWGVVTFIIAHSAGSLLGGEGEGEDADAGNVGGTVVKAGLAGFLYLEILDASFSFDGVIGAFVLTNYLPIIALGLGVGAMFVRSMTIHLVDAGTLSEYRYLEHGAFYAILALAVLMFGSGVGYHLPEWLTGLIGAGFIILAFFHSLSYNRKNAVVGS